jgi:hypothetical protein
MSVAIVSAVSLSLISSSRVEARNAAEEWNRLADERLARSGQEFELYLRTRNIGSQSEKLSDLPVTVEISGFHYTLHFPEGPVELFFESDGGKIDLAAADSQSVQNFFTQWSSNSAAAIAATEALRDRTKRNGFQSVADVSFLPGFKVDDFQPKLIRNDTTWTVRESIDEFITLNAGGPQINPNFAPRLVLLSIPDLLPQQVDAVLQSRTKGTFFKNADDLRLVIGVAADSPIWKYFRFDRGVTPSVLTMIREKIGGRQHSERRVYEIVTQINPANGRVGSTVRLRQIQFDLLPPFIRGRSE